jgi:Asp/Glu/hydantoin racemase
MRVLIVGPTSSPWADIAEGVEADLARLRRPGVDVAYRCTGAGPAAIRTSQDAIEAAPHVVRTVTQAAGEEFDAVIIDCTDDPGVEEARAVVSIPVVGAGEALWAAITTAPAPVRLFTGDELRTLTPDEIVEQARRAATVAIGATGHSHVADLISAAGLECALIDPLDAALALCLGR